MADRVAILVAAKRHLMITYLSGPRIECQLLSHPSNHDDGKWLVDIGIWMEG